MTTMSTAPDREAAGVERPAEVGGSDIPHPNGEAPNLNLLVALQGRVEGLRKAP